MPKSVRRQNRENGHTDTHTNTLDNYCNPRHTCAPKVNNHSGCLTVRGTPISDDPFYTGRCIESELFRVSPSYADDTWLQQWSHLTAEPAASPQVPPTACTIINPLILVAPPDKPPTPRVGALLPVRPKPWFSNWPHGTAWWPEILKVHLVLHCTTQMIVCIVSDFSPLCWAWIFLYVEGYGLSLLCTLFA